MDKGWTPPTLHDLEWLPNGQGLDPSNLIGPPNPSRLGGCEADSFCYQILLI